MSKWIGYAVSVNCGDPLGCYQGTILEADGTTITLTKAFRNGFPYPKSQVTLNAADIKDLKIIEEATSKPAEQTHSTVAVTKNNKKGQRATVCENLQANPSHSGNQQNVSNITNKSAPSRGALPVPTRSKPIDIQPTRSNKNNHSGSYGNTGSTPKGRSGPFHEKARRRNEACFGDTADPALDDDFDFEGNLALFDKQALWEEMRSAARPDVVRAADEAARFRHDENVLGAAPALPAIRLPDELRGPVVYSADDGRRVPSAAPRLRRDFWDAMRRCGLLDGALTLLARAAADVALRLAGGGRRLEARNAHQAPVAVVLAGAHRLGAAGLEAARVLAAHGVRAHVLLAGGAGGAGECAALRRERGALALCGVAAHASAAALPAPDVVLLALYDPLLDDAQERHAAALAWVRGARAAVVAVEPPGAGWDGVCARASLLAGLPAALPPALGRVYLANVAPPASLFRELRVAYRPPFGAASVLALD
ncbi:enhancer of mRNA-decapping protein 3 [Vanessa cardui]|uniref:enhancer of mRNA-decapping protein 3 n=1 Tax=Vanessa cardui TaxID=171605 RepID=UPI001F148417|nr:enhancer of mRNA-decapping protein 3 [Vanessa cardui]